MPGTLVLDSEGLSRLYRKDRSVLALLAAASPGCLKRQEVLFSSFE